MYVTFLSHQCHVLYDIATHALLPIQRPRPPLALRFQTNRAEVVEVLILRNHRVDSWVGIAVVDQYSKRRVLNHVSITGGGGRGEGDEKLKSGESMGVGAGARRVRAITAPKPNKL